MKVLSVNTDNPYDIKIKENILSESGRLIRNISEAKAVCLVSDSNVFPLYGQKVEDSLKEQGFRVVPYVFEAGEGSKNSGVLIHLVEFMAENEMTRSDIIVALGGGVCGDMAGFAAAVYLRGIDFVQIPTSLLAQIDSSVGGKTAIDLPQGKNLCGVFHQPKLVLIDPSVLDTLPEHFFSDGMAEAIKYGCIRSGELFGRIEGEDAKDFIEDLIFQCVDIKRRIVERDEKEHGERALLNFGHTVGHAIEKLCNFDGITHGEAVGIGMLMIAKAGEQNGITQKGTAKSIEETLCKYNLKTESEFTGADIISAMNADKKRTGTGIQFIMLEAIGESFIQLIPYHDINKLFGV